MEEFAGCIWVNSKFIGKEEEGRGGVSVGYIPNEKGSVLVLYEVHCVVVLFNVLCQQTVNFALQSFTVVSFIV